MFPTKPYEISCRRSNDFHKRRMTVPESQTIPNANNYRPASAGTKHQNDDKSTKSSDVMAHTYRWMDKHTWRRASERTPRSKMISPPSIRRTSSRPVNAPERWPVKRAWSMPNECNMATEAVPNAIPNDRGMATESVPKEIEKDHQAYRIVYRIVYCIASEIVLTTGPGSQPAV